MFAENKTCNMMNATEFIKSRLSDISDKIPEIGLKYAYDKTTSFHIIEVYPEDVRRGNDSYLEWEYNMWKDFREMYPEEDILISEVDETNDMGNMIFTKTPADKLHIPNLDSDNLFSLVFKIIPNSHKEEDINCNLPYEPITMNYNEAA